MVSTSESDISDESVTCPLGTLGCVSSSVDGAYLCKRDREQGGR